MGWVPLVSSKPCEQSNLNGFWLTTGKDERKTKGTEEIDSSCGSYTSDSCVEVCHLSAQVAASFIDPALYYQAVQLSFLGPLSPAL